MRVFVRFVALALMLSFPAIDARAQSSTADLYVVVLATVANTFQRPATPLPEGLRDKSVYWRRVKSGDAVSYQLGLGFFDTRSDAERARQQLAVSFREARVFSVSPAERDNVLKAQQQARLAPVPAPPAEDIFLASPPQAATAESDWYLNPAATPAATAPALPPQAASPNQFSVYIATEEYVWKEFLANGSQALKEQGTLFGIGFAFYHEFRNHMTIKPGVEIFGGSTNYDGQTQSGTPATTTVGYSGIKLGVDGGYRFRSSESVFLEPFGGIGIRAWTRDIKNGTTSTGSPTLGYKEDWTTVMARLGLRMDASTLFVEAAVRYPIYNENTVRLSEAGLGSDLTLYPGKQPSYFGEVGVKDGKFKASVYYETLSFSKSDSVYAGSGIYAYQPKSTATMVGIRLGAAF
jgi:hypothetical protein